MSHSSLTAKNLFFFDHYLAFYHLAGPIIRIPNDRIHDYRASYFRLGVDLSDKIKFFDSLSVSGGVFYTTEVLRSPFLFRNIASPIVELCIEHKGIGIRNVFYMGKGHNLDYGDQFYRAKQYDRLDFYFTPLHFKNVYGRFMYTLHYIENHWDNQQQFQLYYTFK